MDSRKNVVGRLLRSVTFRLILLTLASGLGLWLGAGSRSTLPGKAAAHSDNPGKWLIADAFRFDILLARAEPATPPAVPAASQTLPAAVVVARSEPVATMEAPMKATLCLQGPARPTGPWQARIVGQVAQLRQTQNQGQERLKGLPGLVPADRQKRQERLQCELQRASEALETLTLEQPMGGPERPAIPEVPVVSPLETVAPGCTH
jgi:hypothetical protein